MKQGELFAETDPRPRRGADAGPSGESLDARSRRRAVTCFDRPLLLEAGAGTGKTATLVARVLHWCLGPGWDEVDAASDDEVAPRVLRGVAAITFTEAAAAEMSSRVGQALATVQRVTACGELDPDALPRGLFPDALPRDPALLGRRARALRAALDHLNVSTIHAFCRRLLAAHPLEAGLDPGFQVDATFSQLAVVVRDVLEAYLHEVWTGERDPDVLVLAQRGVSPPDVESAVIQLVEEGARAADFLADPLDATTCERMRARLAAVTDKVAALAAPFEEACQKYNTRFAMEALATTRALLASRGGTAREVVDTLCRSLADAWKGDGEKAWRRIKDWRRGKLIQAELLAVADPDALAARSAELVDALEPFLELDLELLESARGLVGRVLQRVEAERVRRGVVTFADLLVEARRLLADHPRIAAHERRRMRQLLVDEFQDTDGIQCDIVAALGLEGPPDGRPALFLVGDPKQSIFAWRNADLAAYDEFAERVGDAGGEQLALSRNFRSRRAILDEVGRAVAPVMEEVRKVQPAFAPLEAGRADAGADGGGPAVEYWLSWPFDPESGAVVPRLDRRKEASYAAEAQALADDVVLRHGRDGVPWKEIALVFRALTQVEPYLQELRQRGVPYEVQTDRKYYQRREVVDATALVRAVLDPNDHLALVTLLRSPMVGAPDAALPQLWAEGFPGRMSWLSRPGDERLGELEDLARRAAAAVPSDVPGIEEIDGWVESLVEAIRAIAELRAAFREDAADRWVERLRARFLPDAIEAARFLGAYRVANLERFFRDLLRALEERAGDVSSVLRTLRANLARDDRSEATRPADSGQDAVQVLTIHGAKGLEFAHVYLAQAHKEDGGFDERTAIDRRGGVLAYRLFGAPSPGWFDARRRRDEAEAAERVRLLYVALTRAKERLVVLGGWTPDARRKSWRDAKTFVDLLAHRAHVDDALAYWEQLAGSPTLEPWLDAAGAAWRLAVVGPPSRPGRPPAADGPHGAWLSPDEVARDARFLASLREAALARMERPFHGRASEEGHLDWTESRAGARASDAAGSPAPLRRDAAMAAGTAVHRVLEELALGGGDARAALARASARLEHFVDGVADEADRAAVLARARELCERLADNGLLDRLAAIGDGVLARELPVLSPPADDDPGAAVGYVSGTIDLLYRDPETGEIVVADYKTDVLEGDVAIAARAETYRGQGRAYLEAVQAALGLAERPRFELWFLVPGRIVPLVG